MTATDDQDALRWLRPIRNGNSRAELLRKRHVIRRAVRGWLDAEGFIEIDAPLLVRGTTPDAAIESFAVGDRYLVTSTEFQIKRMIAGGFERVYSLTQNFRLGDIGSLNNPEFTMLEWARAGADLEVIERDVEKFVATAAAAVGISDSLRFQNRTIDLRSPWNRLTVKEAVSAVASETLHDFELSSLQSAVRHCEIPVSETGWNDVGFLFSVLIAHVQGSLGHDRPVFLRDWPSFQASSAPSRTHQDVADRSELIIGGLEIADGFPSLTDAGRQREAFAAQQARRTSEGLSEVGIDERYIEALQSGLPEGAGMALGFDRLVMVLTNQTEILPVLAFGWGEL